MRIISLEDIKGNEVLAKDIINTSGVVLIQKDTILKLDYVQKLKELEIDYVFVEDVISKNIDLNNSLEIKLKEELQEDLKGVFEKYINNSNMEFVQIKKIAEEIINSVLKDKDIIYSLNSIRERNESTYSHSLNVGILSVILALRMGFDKDIVHEIAIAALLHDIGFSYVKIDYKDIKFEKANPQQKTEIINHVIYGYEIADKINTLSGLVKEIILTHHEYLDGSGYPFRLTRDKIRIESKIVTVCDMFDSMSYGHLTKK